MTDPMPDPERAAFEQWIQSRESKFSIARFRVNDLIRSGEYVDTCTHLAWLTWRERASRSVQLTPDRGGSAPWPVNSTQSTQPDLLAFVRQVVQEHHEACRAELSAARHANNAVYVSHQAKGWQDTDPAPEDLRRSRQRLKEAEAQREIAEAMYNGTWSLT